MSSLTANAPNIWLPESRVGIIDGDLLCYSTAFRFPEDGQVAECYKAMDSFVVYLRDLLELDDFTIYLSGDSNFRKELVKTYKANRRPEAKPLNLQACKDYLRSGWAAKIVEGYEADDLLGIRHTEENENTLVMSYDKDMKQLEGWHFDWRNWVMEYVDRQQADYNLVLQTLTGDTVDNVKGIYRCGPVKASKILGDTKGFYPMMEKALAAYYEAGLGFKDFEDNYRCLKILRTPEQEWPELEELR